MSITTTDLIGLLSKIELDNNYRELEILTPDESKKTLSDIEVEQVGGNVVIYPKNKCATILGGKVDA